MHRQAGRRLRNECISSSTTISQSAPLPQDDRSGSLPQTQPERPHHTTRHDTTRHKENWLLLLLLGGELLLGGIQLFLQLLVLGPQLIVLGLQLLVLGLFGGELLLGRIQLFTRLISLGLQLIETVAYILTQRLEGLCVALDLGLQRIESVQLFLYLIGLGIHLGLQLSCSLESFFLCSV